MINNYNNNNLNRNNNNNLNNNNKQIKNNYNKCLQKNINNLCSNKIIQNINNSFNNNSTIKWGNKIPIQSHFSKMNKGNMKTLMLINIQLLIKSVKFKLLKNNCIIILVLNLLHKKKNCLNNKNKNQFIIYCKKEKILNIDKEC